MTEVTSGSSAGHRLTGIVYSVRLHGMVWAPCPPFRPYPSRYEPFSTTIPGPSTALPRRRAFTRLP